MIELIFTACSILNGAKCHDVSMTFQDVSLMTCMVQAQQPMAQWKVEHPNFSVSERWTCQVAGQFAKM